jgi:Predicted endonuclease distantly related to archaeal Holliday junction resolvase
LGEIDIIAWDRDCLCFVEVKARSDTAKGWPEEAVGRAKIRKISQNVLYYLKSNAIEDCSMRFDVVAVILDEATGKSEVNLIKDAFELAMPYFYE